MNSAFIFISIICISWLLCAFISNKSFLAFNNTFKNHTPTLFFYIPPFLMGFYFIALKPFDAGGDTARYLISFSQISNPFTATTDANYGSEILFWPIQATLKLLLNPREWLIAHFIIVSTLNYLAYKSISQKTDINPLLFALLYLTYFAVYDANAMRQSYSVPLGVIAFSYCCQRKNLKFLLCTALAISFHWSALIILLSPFFTRIPPKTFLYFAIPSTFLLAAPISAVLIDIAVDLTGFSWLESKSNAYIKGEYTSHLTEIWLSLNFWASILCYCLFIITNAFKEKEHRDIANLSLMFLSITLISINYVDVSDRYMVNLMFMMPLLITTSIARLHIASFTKNLILIAVFIFISILVYSRETFISAMGIY